MKCIYSKNNNIISLNKEYTLFIMLNGNNNLFLINIKTNKVKKFNFLNKLPLLKQDLQDYKIIYKLYNLNKNCFILRGCPHSEYHMHELNILYEIKFKYQIYNHKIKFKISSFYNKYKYNNSQILKIHGICCTFLYFEL